MKKILNKYRHQRYLIILSCFILFSIGAKAQTDLDALMMSKNNFCTGLMYGNSKWDHYWEGTLKRNNQNIGTVSSNMYAIMGNYGISSKLNVLFGLPYIQTKESAGTLKGMQGLQDVSVWIKWMPYEKKVGKGTLSLYGIGGISFPSSNYVADFLPLSIGLKTKNLSLRAMADYQVGHFFTTVSGTYVLRSNLKIDRNSYYTDQIVLSNEVSMPDAITYNIRMGYRSGMGYAEFTLNNWTTLGGFDITRNNMPFPSNKMIATVAGIDFKYNISQVKGLALIGGANFTVGGRNMGQANSYNGGVFYIIDFNKKDKDDKHQNTKK